MVVFILYMRDDRHYLHCVCPYVKSLVIKGEHITSTLAISCSIVSRRIILCRLPIFFFDKPNQN